MRAQLTHLPCSWQGMWLVYPRPSPCPPFPARAVRSKLLMLLAPFLKKWNYTRVLEQASDEGEGAKGRGGCVG